MRKLILTLCFLLAASGAQALVTDWPHNETEGITCVRCHSYSIWWQYSPIDSDPDIRRDKTTVICVSCHSGENGAEIFAETHSHEVILPIYDSGYADWKRACVDCHDPHFQAQLGWYGDASVANEDLFLVQGKIGNINDNGDNTTTFSYSQIVAGIDHQTWDDNATDWTRKSGTTNRNLIVALPVTEPVSGGLDAHRILSVDPVAQEIMVDGLIDPADDNATFGLFYGQLIRDQIDGPGGPSNVKFFDPYGGFVDDANNEGLCQVCHSQTKVFCYDDNATETALAHNNQTLVPTDPKKDEKGQIGKDSRCSYCHKHDRGFAPASGTGQHDLHLAMEGISCGYCHTSGTPDYMTEKGCNICHNDGRGPIGSLSGVEGVDYIVDAAGNGYGLPNDMTYRAEWTNEDTSYSLNCNSCHNGRLVESNMNTGCLHVDECISPPAQVACASGSGELCPDVACNAPTFPWNVSLDQPNRCDDCHKGKTDNCGDGACDSCHVGDGSQTGLGVDPDKLEKSDIQAPPVGMQSVDSQQINGHSRLTSSQWIRQYDCFFCHAETVTESYTFLPKHANQHLNVDIEQPQWATDGKPAPKYTYNDPIEHPLGLDEWGNPEQPNTCYNVYCHTDGTKTEPDMRPYPWDGGHQDCNSCHGHKPGTNCAPCHTDGRQWADYPEKKWLSAMPMYTNTGPGSDRANSHYRHLFTGFSCDECHFATIEGGSCLTGGCHDVGDTIDGSMNENKHINPDFHVNKIKDVVFKNNVGTYIRQTKSCKNTACHEGNIPVWGGSVYDSIVCRKCHGVSDADVDDFGKSNGTRARINLTQWETSGHGRQGYVADNGTSDNPYPSGNPPANFPDNGCWYCHDSRVLHQDEERPFRLIQHEHFKQRFEKECVFCHMEALPGDNSECLGCHNDAESLAPQLDNTPSQHAQTGNMTVCSDCHRSSVDPPISVDHVTCSNGDCHKSEAPPVWTLPDHRDFNANGYVGDPLNTSCDTAGCHVDDASRHNTGAGLWDADRIADVKNAYVQMGVCLKCHDDDSSGECSSCHVRPEVDDPATEDIDEIAEYDKKYALGFDPADLDPDHLAGKTAGVIVPKRARASSFHFGYKHNQAYEDSVTPERIIDSGTVDRLSNSTGEIFDKDKIGVWTEEQFIGRRIMVTSGANIGLMRPIVGISVTPEPLDDGEMYAIMKVAPAFPDGQQLQVNDTYKVLGHVWKGGKFCWDCHDPHGDDNIYMIQNMVATRTDGVVGKPIDRKQVSFIRKTTGTDYVDLVADQETGEYNGICNVCHTDAEMHYTSTKGDGHNSSRVCTECHEHRFTNSHASGQSCNSCHRNRPVPRHTAFGQARDCTKCHKDAINARMNIMAQFAANSHHVQGDKVTNKHCYACHWEATPEGVIDLEKHGGYNYKTHVSKKNDVVDLVVWQAGKRPTFYDDCVTDDGNVTAVTFEAQKIDLWSSSSNSSLAEQREQVDNVTTHCLGCHSDKNNDTKPFDVVDHDHGDGKTPRQYAWDRASIDARYSDPRTATFGKYSGPNVAEQNIDKAFSAHGRAYNGGGGWDSDNGTDEGITNTRGGAYGIQCFDCHSSHGSMVEGVTSSYTTFNGTRNGANLKETQAGKGGYSMTYKATANPNPNSINPYQAGAGQCFDCHDTASSNTQVSVSSTTPWGYSDTFGASAPIRGYRDSERFGQGTRGVTERFAYRPDPVLGGHFKASHRNGSSPNYDPSGNSNLTTMGTIDGLCTPCHDPHGISPSLGDNAPYALPLLKGTWMTSPYKEDSPDMGGTGTADNYYRNVVGNFGSTKPMQQRADGRDTGAWRTDRNTFNQGDLSVEASYPAVYGRIGEDPQQFAGLCLRCHPKDSLTVDIDPNDNMTKTENLTWKSRDRIHRSVKGWGWLEGEKEREHSYTCSKCHSAHVSGLPRLMKTNCLNYSHRDLQPGGSVPGVGTSYFGKFPYGFWPASEFDNGATNTCHGADTANGSSGWPANQSWNSVTPWEGQ